MVGTKVSLETALVVRYRARFFSSLTIRIFSPVPDEVVIILCVRWDHSDQGFTLWLIGSVYRCKVEH